MICTSCAYTFFQDPSKMGLVIGSLILSFLFLYLSTKNNNSKKKLGLIYLHIFFLIFPLIFYIFFNGCQSIFNSCHQITPILVVFFISIISSIAFVAILGPILFIRKNIKKSYIMEKGLIFSIVRKYSRLLKIKQPKVYIIDTAKPVAFSLSALKSKIFISIGLLDLVTDKELESVVLHELGHVKNKSSTFKFWSVFARFLTPLANFNTLHNSIDEEEQKADNLVKNIQKTSRFLNSAKRKINNYLEFSSQK